MAAAVMRAMTFGSPSSRSTSTGGDPSSRGRTSDRDSASRSSESRSASRGGTALARTLSGGASGSEGGESLSRTSSRLTAAGSPPPPSILLNSTAPHFYANQSATSSNASNLDLLSSTASTPRPVLQRLPSDASSAYSQVGPTTPASSTFPLPPPAHPVVGSPPALVSNASDSGKFPRQSTIRFAPLPEIRPRSYSTGRNVWIVDEDDGEGEGGQQRTRLVRVGSDVEHDDDGYDDDDAFDFASNDDDDGGEGRSTKWGSWSDTLSSGMWGLTPSTSRRSNLSADDDAVSLSSSAEGGTSVGSGGTGGGGGGSKKLLKAFGLGSVVAVAKGKKKRSGDDDVLARTSSGESQLSRRSSVDASVAAAAAGAARPKGTTGIPLRKASTWEVGDAPNSASNRSAANNGGGGGGGGEGGGGTGSTGGPVYYASPARTNRRRANYPPVAQRSRTAGGSRGRGPPIVRVEEPKFSEWGGSGVGSRASGAGGAGDDDDGSGMAWIRRRRLEREKEAREKAEREAREKEEEGTGEDDEERDHVDDALNQQRAPTPPPPMVTAQSLPLPGQLEAFRRGRQPPSRSGTLDSTISTASTIRPSTPTQSPSTPPTAVVGGLSATRPALVIEVPSRPSSSTASPDSDRDTPVTSPVGEDDDEDSDEEEDEEEEQDESEDDDDLDEEELAREEELAEEARRSAKSMGAERYHSHQHECEVKVVAPTASPEPSS
ncbi:uncharacterized protein RHOBADRAFT_49602 [Rhodotorula graminis WP1]|uniref:Uncharacterized protein n=1 Tax=Rhodotorula graminis (strain WP1) TaxID=578459 RepID=A0A194S5N7_RHOGW|nr:uncharacterized protein RHOBADRAFT_49602 [Rhodotorula graminis WP1]KPV76038.1 hypothetical protein RHOBADRAFT_49602 [Rhodotorula graminis WP1]